MKFWIRPVIISLSNSINSGVNNYGAEMVFQCDGTPPINSSNYTYRLSATIACLSQNDPSTRGYYCSQINTNNGILTISPGGAAASIFTGLCS